MTERVFNSLRELPTDLASQPDAASQNGQHEQANEAPRVNKAAYIRKAINALGRKRATTEAIIAECRDQYGVEVTKSSVYAAKHAYDVARAKGKPLPRAPRRDKGVPRKNGHDPVARHSQLAVHAPGDGDVSVTDLKAAHAYLESLGYDTPRAVRALAVVQQVLGGSVESLRESVRNAN
jgi:hypothetical protein